MRESVFSKMVQGKVHFDKFYEDDLTVAWLDQHPLTKGHTQVIPKQQIAKLEDCPPQLYAAIFATVYKVSHQLIKKLKPLRIAVVVHGLEVPHAHVHVVPLYTGEEMNFLADRRLPDASVHELKTLAKQLAFDRIG